MRYGRQGARCTPAAEMVSHSAGRCLLRYKGAACTQLSPPPSRPSGRGSRPACLRLAAKRRFLRFTSRLCLQRCSTVLRLRLQAAFPAAALRQRRRRSALQQALAPAGLQHSLLQLLCRKRVLQEAARQLPLPALLQQQRQGGHGGANIEAAPCLRGACRLCRAGVGAAEQQRLDLRVGEVHALAAGVLRGGRGARGLLGRCWERKRSRRATPCRAAQPRRNAHGTLPGTEPSCPCQTAPGKGARTPASPCTTRLAGPTSVQRCAGGPLRPPPGGRPWRCHPWGRTCGGAGRQCTQHSSCSAGADFTGGSSGRAGRQAPGATTRMAGRCAPAGAPASPAVVRRAQDLLAGRQQVHSAAPAVGELGGLVGGARGAHNHDVGHPAGRPRQAAGWVRSGGHPGTGSSANSQ